MKKSDELKAQIAGLRKEQPDLRYERAELNQRLAAIGTRLEEIESESPFAFDRGHGQIRNLVSDYEAAKLAEDDADKPRIKAFRSKWPGGEVVDYVLHKVTPKRILLRRPGSSRVEQFRHDGTPISYGGSIPPEELAKILESK